MYIQSFEVTSALKNFQASEQFCCGMGILNSFSEFSRNQGPLVLSRFEVVPFFPQRFSSMSTLLLNETSISYGMVSPEP